MPKNQIKIYKNKCCVCGDNAFGKYNHNQI